MGIDASCFGLGRICCYRQNFLSHVAEKQQRQPIILESKWHYLAYMQKSQSLGFVLLHDASVLGRITGVTFDHILCYANSYSASHGNWCTETLWNRIMTAQCEGMGEVGLARYEPALLPPCPSIRVWSYSNCQEIHSRQQTGLAV